MPRYQVTAYDRDGKGVVRHYDADSEAAAFSKARLELLRPESALLEVPVSEPATVPQGQPDLSASARRPSALEVTPISTIATGIILAQLVFVPMVLCLVFAAGSPRDANSTRACGTLLTAFLIVLVFIWSRSGRNQSGS